MNSKAQKPRAATPPVLEAEGIAMGYDDLLVLRGVDLTIKAGDCVILRGDNGAGKTTLVRGMAGLAPLLAGTVRIKGVDHRKDRVAASHMVVHLGHRDALAAELTVREAASLWARSRGLAPTAHDLEAAFDALDLAAMAGNPIRALSAGQKRRAAMLRLALMNRMGRTGPTPLWLLDEPTAALDASSVTRFAGLVEDHLKAGGAALMTTHLDLPVRKARQVALAKLNKTGGGDG